MQKNTAIKIVFKISLLFLLIPFTSFSQSIKHLKFDNELDKIIVFNDKTYIKLQGAYFNISRFNDSIKISKTDLNKLEFASVEKLLKEARKFIDSTTSDKELIRKGAIKLIETNNQIFNYIYIYKEETPNEFWKIRVWWEDFYDLKIFDNN